MEKNKKKNILFCDDSKFIAHSFKSQFIKYVNIDLAYNLEDLIDKLKNENYHFDLVICDIELPYGKDPKVVKDLEIVDKIKEVYHGILYMISICRQDNKDLKEKLLNKGVNEVFFRGIGEDTGYLEAKVKIL